MTKSTITFRLLAGVCSLAFVAAVALTTPATAEDSGVHGYQVSGGEIQLVGNDVQMVTKEGTNTFTIPSGEGEAAKVFVLRTEDEEPELSLEQKKESEDLKAAYESLKEEQKELAGKMREIEKKLAKLGVGVQAKVFTWVGKKGSKPSFHVEKFGVADKVLRLDISADAMLPKPESVLTPHPVPKPGRLSVSVPVPKSPSSPAPLEARPAPSRPGSTSSDTPGVEARLDRLERLIERLIDSQGSPNNTSP